MTQRIDLYRDDLRPREPSDELRRNGTIAGALVLVLFAWGAVAQWQAAARGGELVRLKAEQVALQAAMTAATERLAQRAPDPALTAALVEAQAAVDGRRWLAEQLGRAGADAVAFSAVLEGLGRQRPEPLWLTRIHVGEGGQALGLAGRALEASVVPGYLERLGREPALQGREFTHFRIDQPTEDAPALAFELATHCAALAGGCDGAADEGAPR